MENKTEQPKESGCLSMVTIIVAVAVIGYALMVLLSV
jgi:hypothetical protein